MILPASDGKVQAAFVEAWYDGTRRTLTPNEEAPQECFNRFASGTYLEDEWWGDLVCWADVQVIRQPWA